MPFKIPTSRKIREKNSASEFGEKRGQKGRERNVRTSNPNSASRISSGTFFSVV